MRTPAFDALLNEMEQTQKHALEQLASNHQDLLWDGGKINTWPLRVSIKKNNRSIAAINTRRKEAYLRIEFRGKDYNGIHCKPTKHKAFDKCYDLVNNSSIDVASEIISEIKEHY